MREAKKLFIKHPALNKSFYIKIKIEPYKIAILKPPYFLNLKLNIRLGRN